MLLFALVTPGTAAGFDNRTQESNTKVAPAVTHIQEKYQSDSIRQAVNLLDINLQDTYTKLEIGIPNPLNSLKKTTSLAQENSYSGHRVVGAINASYFLGNGFPANLLAENNKIINYGILGEKVESPTQQPVAFGISKTGEAIADYYSTKLAFKVNGQTYSIDRMNSERTSNTTGFYTPTQKTTGTNEWGVELVVTNASQDTKEMHFGDRVTGTLSKVTTYGQPGNSSIPADGFVISIQNKALATQLSALPQGTEIEVSLAIDEKWMDAQFILAGGPLLVKDGKVNISMPTNSLFASSRQPRTAIAVDSTGKRVFLVTVDGRLSGYSNGTSLTDLASYLISKGASAAINLDGGGSTTMAVRQVGGYYPLLVNQPSDGYERNVSAILQVVNTAPTGTTKSITLSGPSEVFKGTSFGVKVLKAYDEYMNPLWIEPATMTWSVEGNIGTMDGAKFTATTKGSGKIIGEYKGFRTELPVTVTEILEDKILLDSFDQSSQWVSEAAKANVSVSTSNEVYRQGTGSLKLSYDFTTSETGTKAAYAVAKTPIVISGLPKNIGVWVYGDGSNHWLRGVIVDGNGEKHTIDFTEQGEFNWTGWKYVTAEVPADLVLPLKFDRIYVTEPTASLQNKGQVFFDQLQAVYKENHEELIYTDVPAGYWASSTINYLNSAELIKGYPNGTFKPTTTITRAEAATIIARALDLTKTKDPSFTDVKSSHFAYDDIAAVAEKAIILGREEGKFSPEGQLTRAEMATIIKRAYSLTGTSTLPFKDIDSKHWAYEEIQTLMVNQLVEGYPDNTFRPNQQITRAEFAAFLERVLKMN